MKLDITIEAKPLIYNVEIPGYGMFTVRRLGAGAQADLSDELAAAQKAQEQIMEDFADTIAEEKRLVRANDQEGLNVLRASEAYKEAQSAQRKVSQMLQDAVNHSNRIELGLWDSEDKQALERFRNDFTIEQIRGFYQQVMQQATGDKA